MRLPTVAVTLSRRKKSQDLVGAMWRTEDATVIVTGTDVGAGADLGIGEGTDPETDTGDTDGADLDPETGIGTNTGGAAAETADALGPGQALEESKKSELVERVETASK